VQLPNGLYLDYTPLELDEGGNYCLKSKRGRRRMYGAKLVENLVQALARIILTQAALRCIERGLRLIWTVHDELIFVVSESQAGEARQIVQEELCREVSWWPGLPLHAEISVSKEYAK
jgi:DNA polymerase